MGGAASNVAIQRIEFYEESANSVCDRQNTSADHWSTSDGAESVIADSVCTDGEGYTDAGDCSGNGPLGAAGAKGS